MNLISSIQINWLIFKHIWNEKFYLLESQICSPLHEFSLIPGGSDGKESACSARDLGSIPGLGRSPEEGMATHSSILAGKSHGERSLAGYSPWSCKELDTTERLSTILLQLTFLT